MADPKEQMIGFLRAGYEKKHGAQPTGKAARDIEKAATRAAQDAAANKTRYCG